jgi:hypothetical protein
LVPPGAPVRLCAPASRDKPCVFSWPGAPGSHSILRGVSIKPAVVFPVECIDHDSMNTHKRVCDAYYPLRTASVAGFIELMTRV